MSRPGGGLGKLDLHGPPLPHTLLTALNLAESPDTVDVQSVIRMVEHDPLVTARLLKIVNSAYYGLHRTVDSARRAVVLLGPTTVLGIIVGMSMMQIRSTLQGGAAATFLRLIRHSLATAAFARHLGDVLGEPLERSAAHFTAGLLHDFGKMVLVYNDPERASSLYDSRHLVRADSLAEELEHEQLIFGYDHTEAGEYVARKLDFPEALVSIIRLHHSDPSVWPADHARMLNIIVAADLTAQHTGFMFSGFMQRGRWTFHEVWGRLEPAVAPRNSLSQALSSRASDVAQYVNQVTKRARSRGPVPPSERRARTLSRVIHT